MSLHPHAPDPIPEETARVARAAFPLGSPYLRMRDHFDTLYRDADFAHLFPTRGKPAAPLAAGPRDHLPVRREPLGPAGGGCGPCPDRLEVRAVARTHRSGLRPYGPE